MTIKTFKKRVEQAGGKWDARCDGTVVYSCVCRTCSSNFSCMVSFVILEVQLGSRGRFAPYLYLNCPTCTVIPNRYRVGNREDDGAEKISWSKRREEKRSNHKVPDERSRSSHRDLGDYEEVYSMEQAG